MSYTLRCPECGHIINTRFPLHTCVRPPNWTDVDKKEAEEVISKLLKKQKRKKSV
jgi:hypothetical protein